MKLTDEQINALLEGMELEEPSMSFTRNVMEHVKHEAQPVSLKTKVDNRIIYSLAAVFVLCILSFMGYIIANSSFNYSLPQFNIPKFSHSLNSAVDKTLTSTFLKGFLFVDLIIGLLYFDHILRKKRLS